MTLYIYCHVTAATTQLADTVIAMRYVRSVRRSPVTVAALNNIYRTDNGLGRNNTEGNGNGRTQWTDT